MKETEESSFTIYAEHSFVYGQKSVDKIASGDIPNITYNDTLSQLVNNGFTYDSKNFMLAPLGNAKKSMKTLNHWSFGCSFSGGQQFN